MTGRTWILMIVLLALNWGGFVVALVYGQRREARRHRERRPTPAGRDR